MALAVVRSLGATRRPRSESELDDYEQELVDQYLLAMAGAGVADRTVADERSTLFDFARHTPGRLWQVSAADADRYLVHLRRDRELAVNSVYRKTWTLTQFYGFLISRYQGDIHALTGHVLVQPIDEFNRPTRADHGVGRVPPPTIDVEALFGQWRDALPGARKYLPAARDYLAASLWRRLGLRTSESALLDVRDWRPDLGEYGSLHIPFGKGSRGRGPKTRLVPCINESAALLRWWFTDVRHQFGDEWANPDAPLLPSERHDPLTGACGRARADALRSGLATAVGQWLPAWNGRLTPHGLRHYCASSLYERGVDLKAIQDLLGHSWLSTTTRYIHVPAEHIEQSWSAANARVTRRLGE